MDAATQLELIARLAVGLLLGAAIGFERELQRQPAGFRTHSLVALGAAIFTVVSGFAFFGADADPTRIAAQIVTGIGFIGAGTIIRHNASVRGLTTAASLWAVAAVGTASGAGLYVVAIGSAILIIVVLWLFDRFEELLLRRFRGDRTLAAEPSEGRVEDLP
ncbi:MAG: MgtC/SapB family protein [Chloroflexota bacterium]|nr:MgtC/SapB family protein [Chloroflexota bacterium]